MDETWSKSLPIHYDDVPTIVLKQTLAIAT